MPPLSPASANKPSFDKFSVFILEDQDINAAVLRAYLKAMGIESTQWVRTLADAEAYLAEEGIDGFDLIMLDVMLPDGQGVDFLDEIRPCVDVPICAYTGLANPRDRARLEAAGFDHIFWKPISPKSFAQEVLDMLNQGPRGAALSTA